MTGDAVQPLRINKMNSSSSPSKLPRPLSEIGSTERRRNSPSYNQRTKSIVSDQDSPIKESSPFRATRNMWANDSMFASRFSQEPSPDRENVAPTKRSSIENLKKASRVANSPIFAKEIKDKYDPSSSPNVERPLTDRPLSDRIQQNPFTRYDSIRKGNNPFKSPEKPSHRRSESRTDNIAPAQAISPPPSPPKSSLTAKSRYGHNTLDVEKALPSDEEDVAITPRQSLRPAKSVTFETAPPERHEYEQQTPEPSSSLASGSRESSYESDEYEDNSFERASSNEEDDDSFDASLEDTTRTPVVLPGDWRHASPETARTELVDDMDDVFDAGSPSPSVSPMRSQVRHGSVKRSESVTSEGSVRPLPPIPGLTSPGRGRRGSGSLSFVADRAGSVQRSLPSPPRPAAVSKEEILRMRDTSLSRNDRMSMLALQEALVEGQKRSSPVLNASAALQSSSDDDGDALGDLPAFEDAPQISRESIMRKVKADLNNESYEEGDSQYSDQGIDYSDLARLDPDTPIPSRENSKGFLGLETSIKEEENSFLDMDSIPVLPQDGHSLQRQSSVILHETSQSASLGTGLGISDHQEHPSDTIPQNNSLRPKSSVPFLANFLGKNDDYDFGLTDYISGDLTEPKTRGSLAPLAAELRSSLSSADESERGESVDMHVLPEAPVIPERKATIKTNGKLKARPSGTQADLEAILQAHRDAVALEEMPDLPAQYRKVSGQSDDSASIWSQPSTAGSNVSKNDSAVGSAKDVKIELALTSSESDLGGSLSLSQEMDRLMDSHQKGYLMRQNTKMVVASRRDFSQDSSATSASTGSAASTVKNGRPEETRKISEKYIQTEPWNGKMRRKSGRHSSAGRKSNIGVAPPLPGHESALGTLEENSILSDTDSEAERGRLFVKVVGVKDLNLPLPRNDRLSFQLTLDNGLHCVTTGNLDLGKSAPIGQEFELVVQQDLDFQLTLTTNLPPLPKISQPASFTSSTYKPRSPTKNVFSRLLSSPKKRAEQERRAQAEFEAEERRRFEDAERQRLASRPTTWDKLRELVDGTTGSFGRSYISLKSYEEDCYGRQLVTDVPLYNEWAIEQDQQVVSSVRSKRSNGFGVGARGMVVRCPPYQIGSLEVHLLYIPRAKNLTDEDMPKSMTSAIREMKEAERVKSVKHEGYLSQQGGDCPYWRRRFFRLAGSKLTAYHEHTMQPRATINLAKAARLIDDKTSLVADPNMSGAVASSKRRKSAFAEEDDGYQFVEEGFRLRFNNGETIDFYADSTASKEEFMVALSQAMGKSSSAGAASTVTGKPAKWTEAILEREQKLKALAAKSLAATSSKKSIPDAPEINICPPSSSTHFSSTSDAPPAASSNNNKHASWAGHEVASYTRSAPTSPVKKSSAIGNVVRDKSGRGVPTYTFGGDEDEEAGEAEMVAQEDDDVLPAVPEKDVASPAGGEGMWLASGNLEGDNGEASAEAKKGRRKAVRSMLF